jgi:hypothetical protein
MTPPRKASRGKGQARCSSKNPAAKRRKITAQGEGPVLPFALGQKETEQAPQGRKKAMPRPELKQFAELEPDDFERHPVWIGCHTADYGKPWYESTDEETFRPRTGKLPADPFEGMLLVKATFKLRDGSRYTGFVTPSDDSDDLGTQQPQMFVQGQRFSFWGGMAGISSDTQQALYAALNRGPNEIFPLRFAGKPEFATGVMNGEIKGFYSGGAINSPERIPQVPTAGPKWFRLQSNGYQPDPQPQRDLRYKKLTFHDMCERCGIRSAQSTPFRFNKFRRNASVGFWQPACFYDVFIVPAKLGGEIEIAGITGVSIGPVLGHRSGVELPDYVQLHIARSFDCVEVSRLPTVTCRPNNEEVMAMRKKWPEMEKTIEENKGKPSWWSGSDSSYSDYRKEMDRLRAKVAVLPFCGRVKYHPPTYFAIIDSSLNDAPDLCQSTEWFGSGALAYRLTFASERFVALARERKWNGLIFSEVSQHGFSERKGL